VTITDRRRGHRAVDCVGAVARTTRANAAGVAARKAFFEINNLMCKNKSTPMM
jgi:hypothetical protein